jgi:hypothetical protein
MNTIRLLGAAQLIVFVASMLSERLLASAVGSGGISEAIICLGPCSSLSALYTCPGGAL